MQLLYVEMHRIAKDGFHPMAEDKPTKKSTKDSQLVVRLNRADRDRFIALCDELDTSAAREVRRFIKAFLREHEGGGDGSSK